MKYTSSLFFFVTIAGCSGGSGTATAEQPSSDDLAEAGWADCNQKSMTGESEFKTYSTTDACVADRPTLQAQADTDGRDKCTKYCAETGAGCVPQPAPKPGKTQHSCVGRGDPPTINVQNVTAAFDCICKKPS